MKRKAVLLVQSKKMMKKRQRNPVMMIMMKGTSHHQGRSKELDLWSVYNRTSVFIYCPLYFRIIKRNQRKPVKFILVELAVK